MSFELHNADCLDVPRKMPDGSVDAVVTDPPYCSGSTSESQRTRAAGQGLRSETIRRFGWFVGDNMGTAGLVWLMRSVAVESKRVCKPTGSLLAFCDWRMMSSLQPAIESAGLRFQNLIVWDKASMGLGIGFRHQHELILHFTFGSPEYSHKGTSNVLTAGRVQAEEREHQTEKPVELMRQLVSVVVPPSGVVLDPFMGSGTTIVSALQLGRSGIGIEIDKHYFDVARKRIEEAASEGPLFAKARQLEMFATEDEAHD